MSTIFLFRGKAATGKTTITNLLSEDLNTPVIRKDDIYDTASTYNLERPDMNSMSYDILVKIVQTNIDTNCDLILDIGLAHNPYLTQFLTRIDFKQSQLIQFLCTCSDDREWKKRIEKRIESPAPNQIFKSTKEAEDYYSKLDMIPFERETALDSCEDLLTTMEKINTAIELQTTIQSKLKNTAFFRKLVQIRNSKLLAPYFNYIEKKWDGLNNYKKGLLLVLLTWGIYFLYVWPRMFFWGKEGIYAGWIGIWGDWSAHSTYASKFAYQNPIDWLATHPLYIDTKFTYPFLVDLISGLLIRIGMDRVNAFVIPTIVITFLLLWFLYGFYFAQFKSYKKAILGVFIFLTSGGLGFLWFFRDLKNDFWNTLSYPPDQYTQLKEGTIYWLNTITGQLIPQRAMLIGMTIGLFVIPLLYKYTRQQKNSHKYLKFSGLGLITSLLVLAHVHTFIVIFFLSAVIFLLNLKSWKALLVYGISTAIPALIFYQYLYGGAIHADFFKWHPGWLSNAKSKNVNFIYFWFLNWGLFLPLAICGYFKKKDFKNEFFITGIILFILGNLFLFQPFDWDNSKIFIWVYLFWTIPVVEAINYLWKKKRSLTKFIAIMLIIIISLSGSIDIYRLTKVSKMKLLMFPNDDIKLAQEFRKISNPNSIVLTSDKHNHFIPTLTGRQILLGYRGWIWTYGIDYKTVEKDILTMYHGGKSAQALFKKYDISYVVIGLSEKYDFKANEQFFLDNYPVTLKSNEYKIFKIQ